MATQTINLNNVEPVAPTGALNIQWQADAPSLDPTVVRSVSAYVPVFTPDTGSGGAKGLVPAPAAGDAAAGKVLKADGTWYVPPAAPIATTSTPGLVKPDGATVSVAIDGTIAIPTASTSVLGVVKPDGSTITISDGVISASGGDGGFSNPMTTEGDLIVGSASGAAQRLATGSSGQVLTANGSGELPTWQAPTSSVPAGFPLFFLNAQSSSNTGWENYTIVAKLSASTLWMPSSSWALRMRFTAGSPVIGGMAILRTLAGSASVIDVTDFTIGGSTTPTLSSPGIVNSDAITLSLDFDHDLYACIFFSNVSANSAVSVASNGTLNIYTGQVSGNILSDTSIPPLSTANSPYLFVGAFTA